MRQDNGEGIIYRPYPDTTPATEISALSLVYKLCLEKCHARERGRLPDKSGPDDAKGSKHDRAKSSIHE